MRNLPKLAHLAAGTFVLASAFTRPAAAQVVYSNDFEANANNFAFSGGDPLAPPNRIAAPNGSQNFLGNLTLGGTATLNLTGLAPSTAVMLSFSLYAVRTVDGDGARGSAPDPFRVTLNGLEVFNRTFANFDPSTQSFPNPGSPARSGSVAQNTLGFENPFGGSTDTTYAISFTTLGAFTDLSIAFSGLSDQAVSDEFYGVDNLTVTTTALAVPGPIAGAGLPAIAVIAGAWFWRRRKLTAEA